MVARQVLFRLEDGIDTLGRDVHRAVLIEHKRRVLAVVDDDVDVVALPAVGVDDDALRYTGTDAADGRPQRVARDVQTVLGDARGVFSASENGRLIYLDGGATRSTLAWFDADGKRVGTVIDLASARGVRLSPDGRLAAIALLGEELAATKGAARPSGRSTSRRTRHPS